MNVVLASNSPRRKELLKLLGLNYIVDVSNVDETYDKNLLPHEVVLYLSCMKAKEIHKKHPQSLIIGADTIVSCDNLILEKPKDKNDAFYMLKKLSNKTHHVITGVTIITDDNIESFFSITDVTFYELSDKEITDYIDTNEPFDKAGSYAIQGYGSKFIKDIKGDYFTVVGLPVGQLYQKLKKYDIY